MSFQYRESHGKDSLIVHLDVDGVIPSLCKLQIVDLVDQVDALNRAVRLKFTGKDLPWLIHGQAHADREDMVARLAIRK